MSKISVIMPCLNMAGYIRQCMDSVIHQTLSDMEIIVVDAGSSDGTLEMLEQYAGQDDRVRVMHSGQKSYGCQMNQGIAAASGEYIGIVETDDVIQPDMFEALYKAAADYMSTGGTADYVKGVSEGFYQGPDGLEWRFPIMPCRELLERPEHSAVPKSTPELFLNDNFLWNGIYRSGFLKKIAFHETPGAAFQDISALFQIISRAGRGIYINHLVYRYRQDNSSASSYNRKGLNFAASEYRYMERFLPEPSAGWQKIYYLKMAGLTVDRFHTMACSGRFWTESDAGITELRSKLQQAVDRGMLQEEDCRRWQKQLWQNLCIFLDSPSGLYEHYRQVYEADKKKLRETAVRAQGRRNVIFGAGRRGQFVQMYLAVHNIKNTAVYCDSSRRMQGKMLQNTAVLSPAEAVRKEPGAYYIIAAAAARSMEMKEQLVQLGIKEDSIGSYDGGMDVSLLRKEEL